MQTKMWTESTGYVLLIFILFICFVAGRAVDNQQIKNQSLNILPTLQKFGAASSVHFWDTGLVFTVVLNNLTCVIFPYIWYYCSVRTTSNQAAVKDRI